MRIELLGSPAIRVGERRLEHRSRKAMALLAYLAMRADEHISRSHLAALLWHDSAEEQARANLRQTLSQLRKLFKDAGSDPILVPFDKIVLVSDGIEIDARTVLVTGGSLVSTELTRRPDFLEGFIVAAPEFESWAASQRALIRDHLVVDLKTATDAARQASQHSAAAKYLSMALQIDPLQEALHRSLMEVLTAQGRTDEALAQFETCRNLLAAELQIEPDAQTSALASRIRTSRRRASPRAEARRPVGRHPEGTVESTLAAAPADRSSPLIEGGQEGAPSAVVTEASLREQAKGAGGPMVAVLPFRNLGQVPDQEFFAAGLTEDIILGLSASHSFQVLASSATTKYRGRDVDPQTAGEELGASYVLAGSVRRGGNRLRVAVELVNVETKVLLWTERYDRSFGDLFEVQDEITTTAVAMVEPAIDAHEIRRFLVGQHPATMGAYELAQRGFWHLRQRWPDGYQSSLAMFESSRDADPHYPRAYAGMAQAKYLAGLRLWGLEDVHAEHKAGLRDAIAFGRKVLELDPHDPRGLRYFGSAQALLGQYEIGLQSLRQAITAHPSYATAYSALGYALMLVGDFQGATAAVETTLRLRPGDPNLGVCIMAKAVASYQSGDYETAALVSRQSLQMNDQFWLSHVMSAASAGQLGDASRARDVAAVLARAMPQITADDFFALLPFRERAHIEHIIEGLHKAGLS